MGLKPARRTVRKTTAAWLMLTGGLFTVIYLVGLYTVSLPVSALGVFHMPSLPRLLLRGFRHLITHPGDAAAWGLALCLLWPIPMFVAGAAFYPWPGLRLVARLRSRTVVREAKTLWPPPPKNE